ncbi:unnamed protein product [Meganyctiphanes norvegica]|uniref:EGF-like domain-containing protein n=1 Tax=Meganyctiphanes norvegica TaxID=48144 RepID=A0AAV2PSW8_MEGNR
MNLLHYILLCLLSNTIYALYGQLCSNHVQCGGGNNMCKAGRCGCQGHTQAVMNSAYMPECDAINVDACTFDDDCGGKYDSRICNMYGICECLEGTIYYRNKCYKTDLPIGNSFLKRCNSKYVLDILKDEKVIPICHPEDNVFCSTDLSLKSGNDIIVGRCICYPGFYSDNKTKLCRPKNEYIDANNLKQYKVLPGMFCHSDGDCIEGLYCKENFCQCPEPCVYNSTIESCDCGDYYDSYEYWDSHAHYVWQALVGSFLGLAISVGWCFAICFTIHKHNKKKIDGPNDGYQIDGIDNLEEQALNHLPNEVNQPTIVPVTEFSDNQNTGSTQLQASVPPYPVGSSTTDGATHYPPGASALSPASGKLPSHTIPQPYGPQPYRPQPSAAMYTPGSYDEPPPSYSESMAQDDIKSARQIS